MTLSSPKGKFANNDFSNGMNQEAAKELEAKTKNQQESGKHSAFAVSRAGAYGYCWGFEQCFDATAIELLQFDCATTGVLADLKAKQRNWARKNGYVACKIIGTFDGR